MLDLTPYGLEPLSDQHSWEQVSTVEGKTTGTLTFADSLVVCWFACSGNIPLLCQALNAVTGWDFSFDEGLRVGRRAINLMRIYNLKCGMTPSLDNPSPRYGSIPVDGAVKGISIMPHWKDMLSNYYGLMGWDPETGKPLPETLERLGLANLIPELKNL